MRILVFLILSFLPLWGAAAQERATFRDWSAACDARLCGIDTAGKGGTSLRIEPLGPARRALYLSLPEGRIKAGSWVAVAVDGVPVARFGPIDGWRAVEGQEGTSYEFAPSIVNIDLLDRFRRGRNATAVFVYESGEAGVIEFSMLGVSAALAWLDDA